MFEFKETTTRLVWDIYAEIAAKNFAGKSGPEVAAEEAAKFADQMCIQRAVRFPQDNKKKPA